MQFSLTTCSFHHDLLLSFFPFPPATILPQIHFIYSSFTTCSWFAVVISIPSYHPLLHQLHSFTLPSPPAHDLLLSSVFPPATLSFNSFSPSGFTTATSRVPAAFHSHRLDQYILHSRYLIVDSVTGRTAWGQILHTHTHTRLLTCLAWVIRAKTSNCRRLGKAWETGSLCTVSRQSYLV